MDVCQGGFMRTLVTFGLLVLLQACNPSTVRCDGHLRAINDRIESKSAAVSEGIRK
jgi:hypothetical protein